ncbi:MAG: MSHA biogenesis protein MshM [Phenylobacterium sp.]|jgi:MSHA biogenesis protein MshM
MYLTHFGLKELPFTLTPNTEFYVDLPCHHDAFAVLTKALEMGEGFIKVTGEVGTGKTLICRRLLNELPEEFITAYIPDPYLSPAELRWALVTELGVEHNDDINQQQLIQVLQKHLIELAKSGKSVVLIVDEAQALPFESLEALRLFTNLETEQRKLVQVVLFAQSELDKRLAQPELRQLRQRISFSYKLRPLSGKEIRLYIDRRLLTAGYANSRQLFSNGATRTLVKASRGIPRLVNILCHKGMMLSYGQGKQEVNKKHLTGAVVDTDDATGAGGLDSRVLWWSVAGGVALSAGVAVLAWWLTLGVSS